MIFEGRFDPPPDTPCAGCPSPILPPPAPRMVEVVGYFTEDETCVEGVREYHPGCWAAELRRSKAAS